MQTKKESFDEKIREHQNTANQLREELEQLQKQTTEKESDVLSVNSDAELERIFEELEEMRQQARRKALLIRRADLQFWQETQSKIQAEIETIKSTWETLLDRVPQINENLKVAQKAFDDHQNEIRIAASRIAGLERSLQQAQIEANRITAQKFEIAS